MSTSEHLQNPKSESLFTEHMRSQSRKIQVFIPALFVITTTVAFFNESSKHEGSDQDQPEDESHEINSSTNRTIHGVLETLIPPHESDHGSSRTGIANRANSFMESYCVQCNSRLNLPCFILAHGYVSKAES